KLLAQNRRSPCIDPVHLKNMLRQVQSDRSNLAHGWLPFAADSIRQQFGTQMPQGGHPPHHSITSSAMASTPGGMVRPSVLAVLRLITNSNFVGSRTGRSPGFSPLRMRPAWSCPYFNFFPPSVMFSRNSVIVRFVNSTSAALAGEAAKWPCNDGITTYRAPGVDLASSAASAVGLYRSPGAFIRIAFALMLLSALTVSPLKPGVVPTSWRS